MKEEEIKKIVASGLNEGLTLNEIHRVLTNEHNVKMTFMELRLLSTEIEDADWAQFDPQKDEDEEDDEDGVKDEAEDVEADVEGGTQIEISKIQRPGAMVSGFVTFLSGIKGEWYLDQMGSLGLSLEDESKQPTEEDMQDFQINLKEMLSGG